MTRQKSRLELLELGWFWSFQRVALGFYLALARDELAETETILQINLLFLTITVYRTQGYVI